MDGKEAIEFGDLVPAASVSARALAARAFLHLLVLAEDGIVVLHQVAALASIRIGRGPNF